MLNITEIILCIIIGFGTAFYIRKSKLLKKAQKEIEDKSAEFEKLHIAIWVILRHMKSEGLHEFFIELVKNHINGSKISKELVILFYSYRHTIDALKNVVIMGIVSLSEERENMLKTPNSKNHEVNVLTKEIHKYEQLMQFLEENDPYRDYKKENISFHLDPRDMSVLGSK